MAFDKEKLNRKAREEEQRQKNQNFGPKILWWKPKQGENRIRLTPGWTSEGPNADMPFREVYRHWSIGLGGYDEKGRSFTCPVKTEDGPGGTCEICDEVTALRNSGNPADQEIAKEIYAKRRMYSNVIDLKDPEYTEADYLAWEQDKKEGDECHFEIGETKIQVFSYGTKIYEMILDFLQDDDLGDFADETVELVLKRKGQGMTGTSYTLKLAGKHGSTFEFKGDFEKLVYDLDNITPFPKEGAMRACLAGETNQSGDSLKKPKALSSEGAKSSTPNPALASSSEEASATQEEEEAPPCFKDLQTQDDSDIECVGGSEDGDTFSPCNFVTACREAKLVSLAPPKKQRRRAAKATPAPTPAEQRNPTMEEVEAELAAALG